MWIWGLENATGKGHMQRLSPAHKDSLSLAQQARTIGLPAQLLPPPLLSAMLCWILHCSMCPLSLQELHTSSWHTLFVHLTGWCLFIFPRVLLCPRRSLWLSRPYKGPLPGPQRPGGQPNYVIPAGCHEWMVPANGWMNE